jgi:predicted MFS family arabinose efflux permease
MTAATFDATRLRVVYLALAMANFAVGIGAFSVVGVLSPLSTSLDISVSAAGWLMTIYAIVYAVSSPVLVALSGRFDRAQVLVCGLVLLALGAVIGALAGNYAVVLASRAMMAVGGGLVTPVTSAVGLATTQAEGRGRALATIFGGLTLAQALGVPVGAWLGYAFSWRMTFGLVAACAAAAALVVFRLVPRGLKVQPTSLATLGRILLTPRLMMAVAFTAFFMGGVFVLYTYLAPFLETRYGLQRTGVTTVLLVYGAGAVLGNSLGGRLNDRIGAGRTLALLGAGQLVMLPLLSLVTMPVVLVAVLIGFWSALGWSFNVPQQARLGALDPARAPVLLALNAAAIYVGTSVGAAIGGRVVEAAGFEALGPIGAAMIVVSILSLAVVRWMSTREHVCAA